MGLSSTSKFSSGLRGHGERDKQLASLLDRLDAKDAADDGRLGRRNTRATYRRSDVHLVVHHPGGSVTERKVLTRDLSAGGLSFIHGGYLHVGTRCDVTLARYVGGKDTVRGTVQHCEHIAGTWHTVGVKLERRVFPKLYLDPEHAFAVDADARDPATISGRVLLLDDNELDRRLMQHHLRRTKIELTGVGRLDQACESLAHQTSDNPFVLAIVDLNLAGDESTIAPDEVVRRVLSVGVPRVAACTAESDSQRLRAVREAGACGVLAKPYDGDRLLAHVATWLGNSVSGDIAPADTFDADEQIFSTLANQTDMLPLIEDFVRTTQASLTGFKASIAADDLVKCRAFCVNLRGGGSSFGFATVTETAAEAVTGLDANMSVDGTAVQLQRLQHVCARLTADRVPKNMERAA